MVAVCGRTGSGKSTLLRLCKPEMAPRGQRTGEIRLDGVSVDDLPARERARRIGYVAQRPEQQIVTDKVWHELAFGAESIGMPAEEIRRRIAETAGFLGITAWMDRDTASLSGGQKQLLNLASVLVTGPDLLLLDEPTAQLDPVAAADLLDLLARIHREYSMTILICEHRLQQLLPLCDRLLLLDEGRLIADDTPARAIAALPDASPLWAGMPAAARIQRALLPEENETALTVRDGQRILRRFACTQPALPPEDPAAREPAVEWKRVTVRYTRNGPPVLREMSLTLYRGESLCLLGANGCGKSTVLHTAAGLVPVCGGQVLLDGKPLRKYSRQELFSENIAVLPQDPQTLFLYDTVRQELEACGADAAALPYDLTPLYPRHPYDLSGGEQQLLALAKALAAKPRVLLLDEPTKGLDAATRDAIVAILRRLQAQGLTLMTVTHDPETAALLADRCALLFGGEVVSQQAPRVFFPSNRFYTTAACRIAHGYYQGVATVRDVVELCRRNGKKEAAP
ncbi:MAG: ABC transporter ATP-binding protein [Clostridia bacterium]|nr:ABC transporter ATP-binding protein [Clostridia bacterium]